MEASESPEGAGNKSRLLPFLGRVAPLVAETVRTRLSWLLFFRTVIITVLLAATVGLRVGAGQPLFGTASVVLYIVCGLSYATILVGALWIRRFGETGIVPLAYVQLLGDSTVASVLVVATGGFDSAFVFLYSLTILNAAAVLDRRAALILAGANSLTFATLVGLQLTGRLLDLGLVPLPLIAAFPSILANVLAFFLVGILAGSLTEQLRRTAARLTEAQETLVVVEAAHETVLQSLPSGVLTVDGAGRVAFLNRAGSDILGATPEAVIGRPAHEVVPAFPLAATPDSRFETEVDERVLGGSVATLGDDGAGQVVVFQDLTELRRLQGDLARAERLQTLGRFAAGMAHELRNPLAAMIGCLQLLRSDAAAGRPLSSEGERMLEIISRESHRLEGLVSDFLTYARPAPPSLVDLDLTELVRRTVSAVDAGEAGVRIEVTAPGPVWARGDAEQIEQVVWNLVGNAVQAVRGEMGKVQGRVPGTVRVQLEAAPRPTLLVDDDGPGISDETRGRVFEPFFTTRIGGTGLGLATSHQIVTSQDGELSAGRSPLGGARFRLQLPPGSAPTTSSGAARPSGEAAQRDAAS